MIKRWDGKNERCVYQVPSSRMPLPGPFTTFSNPPASPPPPVPTSGLSLHILFNERTKAQLQNTWCSQCTDRLDGAWFVAYPSFKVFNIPYFVNDKDWARLNEKEIIWKLSNSTLPRSSSQHLQFEADIAGNLCHLNLTYELYLYLYLFIKIKIKISGNLNLT